MAKGVLLLTGPPGSGKTTAARLIATAAARGVHVEADSFFHFVRGGYLEPWLPQSHPQNVTVMQAVAAAASTYADGAYTTVVDGIISPKWFLRPLAQALAGRGHAVSYAILRPTLATCIARATARSHDEWSDPDVIRQLWSDFAEVGELETHVMEVDDLDPEQVASALTRRWQAGTLHI
ncbi:MAG: AAA family ATPase [Solirubrobacteraceae bacterium]